MEIVVKIQMEREATGALQKLQKSKNGIFVRPEKLVEINARDLTQIKQYRSTVHHLKLVVAQVQRRLYRDYRND